MKVKDVMSRDPFVCDPDTPIAEIAAQMRDLEIGLIPVCDGKHLEGIITDRDIIVRAVAEELDPIATVAEEVMSTDVIFCFQDEDLTNVAQLMEENQIRRLVVLDQNKKLVGVISLGDLATKANIPAVVAQTLREISSPPNAVSQSTRNRPRDDDWQIEAINPASRSETFRH